MPRPAARRAPQLIVTLAAILAVAGLTAVRAPAGATVGDGDASCACPVEGPYVAPAGTIDPFVDDDGDSAPSGARYRVEATGSLPAVNLTVRRTADNSVALSTTTSYPFWGFSPDEDRLVITGLAGGLHAVEVWDLTAAPAVKRIDIATTQDSARLGFSPHGEFFAFTGLFDGTADTVNTRVWDARTGTMRLDTTYSFYMPGAPGKTFGEAAFGFSPDDDEYFYAWVSSQQAVDWRVVDLDTGTQRGSATMTGTGFWRFAPCGEMLAVVSQNNQTTMDVALYDTDTGTIAASESYAVATGTFARTATHHVATVGGVPDQLVAVSPPVPDVCPPRWPGDAELTAVAAGSTSVDLEWSPADDDTGVTAYRIFRGATQIAEVDGDTLDYQATGLTPSTQYTFRVEAGDDQDNWSQDGPSATTSTAGSGPTWPGGAALTTSTIPGSGTGTGVRLTWTAAVDAQAVTGYRVYRDGTLLDVVAASPRQYDATGLTRGTRYLFRVEAIDADGNESTGGPTRSVATDTLQQTGDNSIAGTMWADTNEDSVRGGGEPGLPSLDATFETRTIYAFRIDGAGHKLEGRSAQAGATGEFVFDDLTAGTWVVLLANFRTLPFGMRLQTRPGDLQGYQLNVGGASGWAGADFGLTAVTPAFPEHPDGQATVAGTVFEDLDRDGVRDGGEGPVADYPVGCYRWTTFGGPGCIATSGVDGTFAMAGLGSGTFEVSAQSTDGWYRTNGLAVVVGAGTAGSTRAAELGVLEGRSALMGEVFEDVDADGVQDPGEGGLPTGSGIQVCADGPLAFGCASVESGAYAVDGLVDDVYDLDLNLPAGEWNLTTTFPATGTIATNGVDVTLPAIGLHATVGDVAGTVFQDDDRDGVRDAGEPGLPGEQVCFRAPDDEDQDCVRTALDDPATPADETGRYAVADHPTGPLEVSSDVDDGYDPTEPSDADAIVVVTEGVVRVQDFGWMTDEGTPSAPVGVAISASGSAGSVVSWSPPAVQGDGPVEGYLLAWSDEPSSGSWSASGLVTGLGTTIADLVPDEPGWVRVRAVNVTGTGPWSALVSVADGGPGPTPSPTPTPTPTPTAPASPPPKPPPPPPPPGTEPSVPRKPAVKPARNALVVTWKKPADDGGRSLLHYVVQVTSRKGGPWRTVKDGPGRDTELRVKKLVPGTKYWVRVAAVNSVGRSAWSVKVSGVPRP